jgi:hypothetical protein
MAEKHTEATAPLPPIPRSIHDISNGDHILGFGSNLAEDHPVRFFHLEFPSSWN